MHFLSFSTTQAKKLRGRINYIQVRESCGKEAASGPQVDLEEFTLHLMVAQKSNLDSVNYFSPTAWHKSYFYKVQVPILL